jgi:hypothetical protein
MTLINPEQRVERLYLDVEPFHQQDRHAAQIGGCAADRHTTQFLTLNPAFLDEHQEVLGQPAGDILARPRRSDVSALLDESPGKVVRSDQHAVTNEGDASGRLFESDV